MAIKVLLMGAGQIGSRHLQGLKPFSQPLELTVIDPSKESLALAKERYEAFGGQNHHSVQYLTSLDQVSQSTFDVILVTTNSGVREAVLDLDITTNRVDAMNMYGVAREAGMEMVTLAVSWVMANPAVTAPIIGASRPEQLAPALKAAEAAIDPGLKARLDELTADYRKGDAAR